jgi:hypothetical protein
MPFVWCPLKAACDWWLKTNNPFEKGGANVRDKRRYVICSRGFKNGKGGIK